MDGDDPPHEELPIWNPDCLDKVLGCWKGSPKTKAATGYYMLRILYSVLTVHSAIIFASVLTYSALQVTNCLHESDDEGDSCRGNGDDKTDDGVCVRLWGIIKPDSLLTIVATVAAVIVALTAAIVGTAMDVSSYRRQLGLMGYILALIGMMFCLTLSTPNENTLIVSSIGLGLIIICKAYVLLQVDSYGPELSSVHAEVSSAISGAFTWSLIANILLIIIWSVIGMGMSNSTFGLVVTIGSIVLLILASYITYSRLPDVPAAHKLPINTTLIQFTLQRFIRLIIETYYDYPDLGLLILSGMIFDPALTTIFAAAVTIMISKYNFSADQVTIILGLAIIAAIPAVPFSRWIASTPVLSCIFQDASDVVVIQDDLAAPPTTLGTTVGTAGTTNTSTIDTKDTTTVGISDTCTAGIELLNSSNNGSRNTQQKYHSIKISPYEDTNTTIGNHVHPIATELQSSPNNGDNNNNNTTISTADTPSHIVTQKDTVNIIKSSYETVFHAHRVRIALIIGLVLIIINTILVVNVLQPCDLGLACLFSCIWGFLLSFCWNSHSMLRIAVVPGGRESEFAGLYLAVFSSMIWLPLFVFSIANEVWNIDGALYILTIFMGIGGIILFFVDLNRGLSVRLSTLSLRRWAHVIDSVDMNQTDALA